MPHANGNNKDYLIDAAIAGGTAYVAVLVASGLPTLQGIYAGLLAFAGTFLASLAAARGRGHE